MNDLIERLRSEAEISDRPGQYDRLNELADEFAAILEATLKEVKHLAASEKTCRRIANEKTLEAMALREALAALKAENERLREALKDADNELDWLDEDMDTCDHSVGMCMCDYWNMRRKMKAALSKENSND